MIALFTRAAPLLALLIATASPAQTVELAGSALAEASGLTHSRAHPGHYWAHNDSGHAPVLWRLDAHGHIHQRVRLRGAENRDWEDIASLHWQGRPALLVGDIGDNRARRDTLQLYLVAEPAPEAATATPLATLRLRYEDGPRDAEGLAWDPVDGRILLLSKRDQPPRLYALTPDWHADAVQTASLVGPVPTLPPVTAADLAADPRYGRYRSQPTALDLAADGRQLLIVTYKDAYLYRREQDEDWAGALRRTPRRVNLPQLPQTEGGGFDAAAGRVLAISERRPTRLAIVPVSADNAAARPTANE